MNALIDDAKSEHLAERARALISDTIVWDNHACMPLRPDDASFLPQLERCRKAGFRIVSLNVSFDLHPPDMAFLMLAAIRNWVAGRPDHFCLANSVADIELASREGRLAIVFDIEGGRAVEPHIGLVEIFYRLGVRWMSIAYNQNNRLGGGCQDNDCGLTAYGRAVIDEMERVGMLVCCSHTGRRTAREVIDHARKPVIFSHSNSDTVWPHPRNLPDDLIRACAATGGVIGVNGIGTLLGDNDNSSDALIRHIDHIAALTGPEHVGLALDYVFDAAELDDYKRSRPDLYPPEAGYRLGVSMVEPERVGAIAEALLRRGYSEPQVQNILGHNFLRLAREVWK